MTVEVIITPKAEALINAIDAFWSQDQPDSRTIFRDELERALHQLESVPGVGPPYVESPIPNARSPGASATCTTSGRLGMHASTSPVFGLPAGRASRLGDI
jgi:hypothetical protein